jgi:hypothetical protein
LDAALLMANAGSGFMGFHIPGNGYTEWFRKAGIFEELVLFMDCCRDDVNNVPRRNPPWDEMAPVARTRTFFAGLATQWSLKAREEQVDGKMQGLFTRALLDGFKNAADELGQVTSERLGNYIGKALAKDRPGAQEPDFICTGRPLVFCTLPQPNLLPVVIRLIAPAKSQQLVIRNNPLEVILPSPAQKTWRVQLPAGYYKVIDTLSSKSMLFEVVGPGVTNVTFENA